MARGKQLLIALLSSALVSGCTVNPEFEQTKQGNSKPRVLTTFTVLADMARHVAGDRLQVRSIVKPGAEIHGYEPTPSDLEQAADADLVVENGLGLELWADRFLRAAGNVPRLTLSQGMEPLLIEGDAYAGKPNPHAWMSPQRAMGYVDGLVAGFSQLDPEGAAEFRRNGANYKQQLQQLDQELRSALSELPPKQRLLVSCEGAFSYLAHDYGLEEAYLWPVNAESQVTPRRMAQLLSLIHI